mgnify:FL=1|jgi:ferredoxin
MEAKRVWAVYFSATGTTRRAVSAAAGQAAEELGAEFLQFDFTLPAQRREPLYFSPRDLVVFGTPVYAGRVPNVLLKYLSGVRGGGAAAVPMVVYGNRDYDDALIELRDILEKDGFHTIAAAAFVGEHSFSDVLAKGRPDSADLELARNFGRSAAEKFRKMEENSFGAPIAVKGTPFPYRGYYRPRDRKGNPVDIRRVKPLTGDGCVNCGLCARVCPMGSISPENVREFTGICIKCGACIKKCPQHAKYYDDAGYLYHRNELEEGLKRRAEPELFA